MKRIAIFTMVCLLATALFSACGPDGVGGDGNWWTRMELATGIKSITEVSNDSEITYQYDKTGRLVRCLSKWYDETTTYDADGLITKLVSKTLDENGAVSYTHTTTFTYGSANKDRFLPRNTMGNRIMHLDHVGLLPGLVKVESNDNGSISTVEYSIKGDILTAKGTGKEEWDNFEATCEYKGAYPNKADGEYEFMGPIDYYENGMFKSYTEGFKDDNGTVTTTRTTTYKNFDNKLNLMDKMVETYSDGGKSTTTCTYDKYGNLTKELREYRPVDSNNNTTEYSDYTYEYDSKGAWTKMTVSNVANDGKVYYTSTVTRTIEYY